MPAGNETNLTTKKRQRYKQQFIEAYRKERSVTNACKAIGKSRKTVYEWRKNDESFAQLWEEIEQQTVDDLETSAMRRALEGWDEPVFYRGEQCGTVRKFSNALTIFMLKCWRRERYAESVLQDSEATEKANAVIDALEKVRAQRLAETEEAKDDGEQDKAD